MRALSGFKRRGKEEVVHLVHKSNPTEPYVCQPSPALLPSDLKVQRFKGRLFLTKLMDECEHYNTCHVHCWRPKAPIHPPGPVSAPAASAGGPSSADSNPAHPRGRRGSNVKLSETLSGVRIREHVIAEP